MRLEHPKPQMFRPTWLNLNGEWDFAFDFQNSGMDRKFYETGTYDQKINVPFCPESKLSGIEYKDFIQAVWYKREIELTESQLNERILLHFGAVDYYSKVWVNGEEVGSHSGGYSSFSFDITKFAKKGENTIVVYAFDDVRSGKQPRGKQSANFYSIGCDYTRTTGIWQTVWLEFVPNSYIKSFKLIPDGVNSTISAQINLKGCTQDAIIEMEAFFEGKLVGKATRKALGQMALCEVALSETHLWDIGTPNLYDLKIRLIKGDRVDEVTSYFGLRNVEWKKNAMYLNGRPVFQRLILDQGFYIDGIYTAPSDEDLIKDIQLSMDLGFNGARLHEKVFEERFLYHADRLGYLVWGEHANWGLDITTADGIKNFLPEWIEVVERDFNHPAIVGWCPFNETWDTPHAKQDNEVLRDIYLATKAMDPTRPVIDTSGNYHVVTDIYDVHDYEQDTKIFETRYGQLKAGEIHETFPDRQKYQGEPFFVSEYGGTWWKNDASPDEKGWGYGMRPKTMDEVLFRYENLTNTLLQSEGICAFCYTQLYDVEQELNGLYTYDRKLKFSHEMYEKIKAINTQVAAIEK